MCRCGRLQGTWHLSILLVQVTGYLMNQVSCLYIWMFVHKFGSICIPLGGSAVWPAKGVGWLRERLCQDSFTAMSCWAFNCIYYSCSICLVLWKESNYCCWELNYFHWVISYGWFQFLYVNFIVKIVILAPLRQSGAVFGALNFVPAAYRKCQHRHIENINFGFPWPGWRTQEIKSKLLYFYQILF